MASDTFRCARCGEPLPEPTTLGPGLRGFTACRICECLVIRDLGEMLKPEDRAEPESWGGLGWA